MSDATVRANAQTMPIDRRHALGALAAVAGALIVPDAAKAESPDAELIALARKAKALAIECKAASDAAGEIERRLHEIAVPEALRITAVDARQFSVAKNRVGLPFAPGDIEALRANREAVLRICRVLDECDSAFVDEAEWRVARTIEVERARERYDAEQKAVSEAAGLSDAQAKHERLSGELSQLHGAIAFTPARTVEGVLAKLDAATAYPESVRIDPEDFADGCSEELVAWMAAVDLAALRLTDA